MLPKNNIEKAYIRFFHAFPVAFSIDIYMDKKLVASDILYEDFTEYLSVSPGEHIITITKNKNTVPLFTKKILLSDKGIYTSIIALKNKDTTGPDLSLIEEVQRAIPVNNLLCRMAHFSNVLSQIDVTLPDGSPVFKNIAPFQVTNYIMLKQGTYSLTVHDLNTKRIVFNADNIRLKPGRFYSIYVIGTGKKDYPIQLVIPIDGNSYLRF